MASDNVTPTKNDGEVLTHTNWNQHQHTSQDGLPADTCRIKNGTYSGDGGTGQAVTGLGFSPQAVWILKRGVAKQFWTMEGFNIGNGTNWTFQDFDTGNNVVDADDGVIGIRHLDNDGFTVSDGGSNNDPNASGGVYYYLAVGTGRA